MSDFGSTIMTLASEAGIPTRAALLRLLASRGHDYKRTTVHHWLFGDNPVPKHFPLAVDEALGIGTQDKMRLSYAYLYGQDPKGRPSNTGV